MTYESKGDNAKLRADLGEFCDEEFTGWLLAEMASNRDPKAKARGMRKAYSFRHLVELASDADAAAAAATLGRRPSLAAEEEHDHLGSPSLLRLVSAKPEVLLPQLRQWNPERP
jgi:hypothetical protein